MSTFPYVPMPALDAGPEPKDSWDDLDDTTLVPTGKTARQLDKPAPDQYARTDVASGLSLGSRASTSKAVNQVAMFKCDACKGSGRFVRGFYNPVDYGPCNKCKGTGKLKTDPETRAKQKQARAKSKEARKREYLDQHLPEFTWATGAMGRFDFARSMVEAVEQHGSWTEGQLAAIRKCMARDEERKKEREAKHAAAPQVTGTGFEKMLEAFARATASGLRYPKLRVGAFTFSLAGERSKYAGQALFVKLAEEARTEGGDLYLGRISLDGRWFPSSSAPGYQSQIFEICHDPMAAAVMHGKRTGRCSCCGLELTNEESVRLGIGPICREKWGL